MEKWGLEYKAAKKADKSHPFRWPEGIDLLLKPLLKDQTNNHCSYCDDYPIRKRESSIDHFKPKGTPAYYQLAFQWENLYFSCPNCQGVKHAYYKKMLLRPDAKGYEFNKYFILKLKGHKLKPNPRATTAQKARAKYTIDLFHLNEPEICEARRMAHESYLDKLELGKKIKIEDFNFRYLFD